MNKQVNGLLEKHQNLTHSENLKVASHVQRDDEDWVLHTLTLDGYDVAFKFRRKQQYKSLVGKRVNLTYYPSTELVAGMEFEYMKVVRIRAL